MARSREVPTFQAPAPEINPDRTYAPLEAFAAPGRAMAALGGAVARIGEDVQQLAARRAQQYGLDHWAEATTQWQDALQNSIDEARQTGNYKGLTQRLREGMDADLNQRVDGAPDGMVASRLKRRFAVLRQSTLARAATFEHGMEVQAAQARLGTGLDSLAKLVHRDPTLAEENYASGLVMLDEAAAAGNLNPLQKEKLRRAFANALWGAAVERGMETDPFTTAKALEAGAYDQFLDLGTLERLRGRVDRAQGEAAASSALSGPVRLGGGGSGDYANRVIGIEIGNLPDDVKNPRSSATGPGQFIDSTWLAMIRRHAPEVAAGKSDSEILALRSNRELSRRMIDAYAAENREKLAAQGLPTDDGALYLAHFLGPGGAAAVLRASPETPMRDVVSADVIRANPHLRDMTAGDLRRQTSQRMGIGSTAGEPPGLAEIFGRIDAMGLSPAAAAHAKERARVQYNALEADAARQARAEERAAKLVVGQAQDEIIADVFSGEPKITAQQVATDPRFAGDPTARLRMIELIRRQSEGGQTSAEASRQETLRLLDRIRRPEGDPEKITSVDALYDSLAGGRLTNADFNFLRKEFDQIRTPAGEVFSRRKADFIKSITPAIDKSNPLMGTIDQSGKQQLYSFEWMLDEKIEEYRRAGKNPVDLLDPSKPDFMGKPEVLAPYQKTLQQSLQDRARALAVPPVATAPSPAPAPAAPRSAVPPAAGPPVATAPIPPEVPQRKPGESPAEYLSRIGGGVPPPAPQPQAPLR